MTPTVSAVIITYNKADTLGPAIESVLRQTYRDFEVLVVDDGSTDPTAEVVKRYGDRVRYLPKENGGTGSARNLGIAESRGRYVALLDGDDLWLPRKLELQMAAFRKEPQVTGVQCSAYLVDQRLRVFDVRVCRPERDTLRDFLLFRNLPAFSSTIVVRREAFDRVGGFGTDLVILSDWDMACRLARAGTIRSIPEILTLYRHYPKNQSRDVDIHIESGLKSLQRFFAKDSGLDPGVLRWENEVRARFYAMLAGGCVRNGDWGRGIRWASRAIGTSPGVLPYVLGMPLRRIGKALAVPRDLSFAEQFPQHGHAT